MNIRIFLVAALGLGLIPAMAKTLLLLPVVGDLEKASDASTVNELYKDALQGTYSGTVKAVKDTSQCADKECAVALAKEAKADEVVYSTLKRLGAKWIFSSTIVGSDGGDAFNQRGTAMNLEDLEAVTKRVSDAIIMRKSVDQVASLDNITAKEETTEPTRRKSLFNTGFSLGYLLPTGGTYAYLKSNSTLGAFGNECPAPCEEKQPHSAMIRLAWLNYWEFRENLMLGAEGSWAIPNVLSGDINLQYLFSKTDISPFAGGGLGIQYVVPLDDSTDESKRNSGPAVNIQGGLVFFRTYDIHVITRAQYQMVFNSDIDNGVIFDVGVVYRPKEKTSGGGGGFWSSFWTYYLIGAVVVGVIGAASN